MKKVFITIISLLLPMLAMGQTQSGTLIAEADFTTATEFTGWTQFDDSQTDGKVELTSEGLAITVGIQTGQLWQPQVMVISDGSFNLDEDGDYKVIVTAKFPTSGTLQINMGSWSAHDQAQFPIEANGDFQIVECYFEDWSVDADGAHLLFMCGDFKGTTILKKIQVFDLDNTIKVYPASEICYNFITKGKVAEVIPNTNGKYYGLVEIPSKVIHEGVEYTVTKIADGAFSGSKIKSITIPNSVTSIGKDAFSNSRLSSITIPNSVTSIGESAFHGCSGLTSITIPNSVTSIGNHAFEWCIGLTSITIPSSIKSIGDYAFSGSALTSVTIPNSVTSIGESAFLSCSKLASVTIPNSVTSIGSYAFQDCSGLTSITIPNSVTSIGKQAFSGCNGLTSITIPNSVTSIGGYAFYGCSSVTSITIPNSVTSIGGYAFQVCTSLTSITIPNSVSSIGSSAFDSCNGLTSVTIGSGVNYIYDNAFANCDDLTDVYCLAENVPSTNTSAFDGSYVEYAILHVPASALNAYKNTAPWSGFGTFETLSGDAPVIPKCATPTISFENGKIKFSCETEGAEFVSNISTTDTKDYYDAELTPTFKYKVTVYATQSGYDKSDTAIAEIEVPGELKGDLNNDGTVNVADHVELTKIILGQE